VFVVHGDADPLLHPQRGDAANLFMSLGADVEPHYYSMGNELNDQELADLTAWINRFSQQV